MEEYIKLDDKYFTIEGWMISKLKLSGNALNIFALIYNITINTDAQEFYGSLKYIEQWFHISNPTIIKELKNLTDSGLLIKTTAKTNGYIKNNKYKANLKRLKELGCENHHVKKFNTAC